jgi:GntR family transcriptional regulator
MVKDDIRRRFLQLIREESFRPGELIGSERELAERLTVGRTVLRLVLGQLEDDGTIRRSLGRGGGVFFHDGRIQRHLNTIQGVPEMVRQQGMTLSTRVVRAELGTPNADEIRNLRLSGDDKVVRLERIRYVDDASWSLDTSVLPSRLFPGLLNRDLTLSLYSTLAAAFDTLLDHADETIEVVSASADQGELLSILTGSPLLLIWRVTYSTAGDAIEFAHDYFRADRTRVHTQKYGVNWKRAVRREEAITTTANLSRPEPDPPAG